jgi:hypothetical protein
MTFSWPAAEDALIAWLEVAVGGGKAIWADQGGSQPLMPYATAKIMATKSIADRPERIRSFEPTAPAGLEVQETIVERSIVTVTCQVFSAVTTGAGTAREYLREAKKSLFLPTQRAALAAAGLAVVDAGDTQDLSALLETTWQSRAAMDVRFSIVDTASEGTGYIAGANLSGSAT